MTNPLLDEADWTVDEVITWLASLGIGEGLQLDRQVFPGPYIPDEPDELFVVTAIAGAGESMEGIGDITGFQLYTRGAQNNPGEAERAAKRADRAIRFGSFPIDVADGNLRLLRVMRSGGGPSVLGQEDGDCTSLTCNYLTEILR
jgi:hypothetical protein